MLPLLSFCALASLREIFNHGVKGVTQSFYIKGMLRSAQQDELIIN